MASNGKTNNKVNRCFICGGYLARITILASRNTLSQARNAGFVGSNTHENMRIAINIDVLI